MANVINGQQMF